MKIANIYDKQLQAIEEAEMKVRIAKRNLKEAERELDETLALVEHELDEARKPLKEIHIIGDDKFAVEIRQFKTNIKSKNSKGKIDADIANNADNFTWELVDENGEIDNKSPKEFDTEEEAEDFVRNILHKTLAKDAKKAKDKVTARVVSAEDINH